MSLYMVTCLSTITVNSRIHWIDEGRTWSTHQCHVSWESAVMTLSPYTSIPQRMASDRSCLLSNIDSGRGNK